MELGKHVEGAKCGKCPDRISSLPDELLAQILSFLPTTCAVSTCILSKRWRGLYTLTNCLSFDDAPCHDFPIIRDTIMEARIKRFKTFVNNVLELHQVSPIEKFSLVCRCDYESDFNAWVSIAVRKGVQDLYCLVGQQTDALREFMCETLVSLKMIGHNYGLKVSVSACLPSLKVLHLEHVTFFNDDSVDRLFSSCKMLEELTLKNCASLTHVPTIISARLLKILTIEHCHFRDDFLEIDAPNLAHLSYEDSTGLKIIPSWKYSCTLGKAGLSFCYSDENHNHCNRFKNDCVLLKAAADKVTELHVMSNTLELVLMLIGHKEMPVFPNLTRFHLCDCPFKAWKTVTSLFEKSPKLENVTFQQCSRNYNRYGYRGVKPRNEDLTPFSCHAKVIEVHHFYGDEYSLLYLGHLLKNARDLKKLILHLSSIAKDTKIINTMNTLRFLPKASKDCSVVFV